MNNKVFKITDGPVNGTNLRIVYIRFDGDLDGHGMAYSNDKERTTLTNELLDAMIAELQSLKVKI